MSGGASTGGALEYGISKSANILPESWSREIPTAKDAGIYYVWYRVDGERCYEDIAPEYVRVVVEKKTVSAVWGETDLSYNGEYQAPSVTLVGVHEGDACKATVSGARKLEGHYVARITAVDNLNYTVVRNEKVSFTISDSDGLFEAEAEKSAEAVFEVIENEVENTAKDIIVIIQEAKNGLA